MLSDVFLLAGFFAFLGAAFQHSNVILTIKQHYRKYYERVGRPPVLFIGPMSIGAAMSFLVYVILGEFNNDNPPGQIIDALKFSRRLFLASFALLLLVLGASFL